MTKMKAQDMVLDEITRKELIWYGHVERLNPYDYQKS
jgi:hypothetical protein